MIYADNAATTKLSQTALSAMLPYMQEQYGNPSSVYKLGRDAKRSIETARDGMAALLGCEPRELYFTGGGTESDNWAIRGTAYALAKKGKHLITSKIEHHAVLRIMEQLEKEGFSVTYLDVDESGIVDPKSVEAAIRPDTTLVSVMFVNNEIGTINDVAEIGRICRDKGVLFHTDAVQAVGHVPIHVKDMNIDLLSLSAHKFHGPKGIGALYVRKGVRPNALILGGAQESSHRAGTENTPGIAGMYAALSEACAHMDENAKKLTELREILINEVLKLPRVRLNGDRHRRVPGNVNFSFWGIEGESLLLMLDLHGICASSGSACTSGSLDPSHVLLALGLSHEEAHGSLRISLSGENTKEDIDAIIEALNKVTAQLRAMSPMWQGE